MSRVFTHSIGFPRRDGVLAYGILLDGDHTEAGVVHEGDPLQKKAIVARHECGGVISRHVDEGELLGRPLAPIADCDLTQCAP